MDVARVSLHRDYIVICTKMTCRARNVMDFAAQAQGFVRSAAFCAVPLGLAFGEWCFWGGGLRFRVWQALFSRQVSAEMVILVDGSVFRTGRNHSKRVVWCKFC